MSRKWESIKTDSTRLNLDAAQNAETASNIKKLWEYLTTYCYLPRLANFSVLESTIRAGVASDEAFAIASSISDERYTGLRYDTSIMDVYPSDYLVKVLNALKQLNQEKQEQQSGTAGRLELIASGLINNRCL